MSCAISRTFITHWMTTSRSSLRAPSTRQRSEASSRTASAFASGCSSSCFSRSPRMPLPTSRARSRFFASIDGGELGVLALQLLPGEQRVDDLVQPLRQGALLRAGGLLDLDPDRVEGLTDLLGCGRDGLHLARGEAAVVACRRLAHEITDLLRVLERDRLRELLEDAPCERTDVVERREHLVLGPVVQAAHPELVVLVERPLLAGREIVAAAREPPLEGRQLLVTVDVDLLRLGADLVLQVARGRRPASRCRPPSRSRRRSRAPSRARAGRCRGGSRCGSGRP